MIDLTDYLTVLEAAKESGLSAGHIRRLITEKEAGLRGLDATMYYGRWHIRKGDLAVFMASRESKQ